ncbi:hypothetical protein EMIT0373P_10794 [Pseudomonas chlororaphis]
MRRLLLERAESGVDVDCQTAPWRNDSPIGDPCEVARHAPRGARLHRTVLDGLHECQVLERQRQEGLFQPYQVGGGQWLNRKLKALMKAYPPIHFKVRNKGPGYAEAFASERL